MFSSWYIFQHNILLCSCCSFKCVGVWKNMTICKRTTISHSSCESYVCSMYDIVLIIADEYINCVLYFCKHIYIYLS